MAMASVTPLIRECNDLRLSKVLPVLLRISAKIGARIMRRSDLTVVKTFNGSSHYQDPVKIPSQNRANLLGHATLI